MIEARDLVFEYPGKRALRDVSLQIAPETITALVGPNGAGKTTLLRCLAGLATPAAGSIRVHGVDVLEDPRGAHRNVGYMSDFFGLYDELTARQCLRYLALAQGFTGPAVEKTALRAASRVGIVDRLDAKAGALSRGQRQRLAIAQSILHEPRVLLLDEPASGLDPEARLTLSELFVELRSEGVTLLVSSHILAELDEYVTDVMILREGRIVDHQPVQDTRPTRRRLRVVLSRPVPGLGERLSRSEGVDVVCAEDAQALFEYADDAQAQETLLRSWVESGLPVRAFGEERRNLQDTYLARMAAEGTTP